MLSDDERHKQEQAESTGWRLAIWGAHPQEGFDRPRWRRVDWTRRIRETFTVAPPPSSPPQPGGSATEPFPPAIEPSAPRIEDIMPLPPEPPPPRIDADLWGTGNTDESADAPEAGAGEGREVGGHSATAGSRYVLPERWAAAPKRRSLLARWFGQLGRD